MCRGRGGGAITVAVNMSLSSSKLGQIGRPDHSLKSVSK